MEDFSCAIEDISPKKAREYLKKNTNNYRKLHRSVVKAYAEEMAAGRWETNGVPIIFSKDGVLKDGQHRLMAIIMSGKTIKMAVARGIENDVTIYDINVRRTLTDVARASGVDCSSTIIAVGNIIVNQFANRRANTDVVKYVSEHIDELNRAQRITCYGTGSKSKNAPCIAGAYLMLQTKFMPSYEVELFFRLMNDFGFTCADGYEVSPPLVAQRMFDDRGTKHAGVQIQKERMEIVSLAMRDFHNGTKREQKYRIQEPFYFSGLLSKVRKMHGLEA